MVSPPTAFAQQHIATTLCEESLEGIKRLLVETDQLPDALLLVDDEVNILRSLTRLFRREGYRILTANSAQEGLDILAQEPVAVILSDQRMPGMTGSEMFKEVKSRYPDTIRLIMSGYTELESITSAINDGAVYKFLLKPWEDEKLLQHIREAFSIHELKSKNARLNEQLKELNRQLEQKVEEQNLELVLNVRSLRASQEILEHLPVAIVGVSDDGMIVEVNAAARGLLGEGLQVGMFVMQVFPEKVFQGYMEAVKSSVGEIVQVSAAIGGQPTNLLIKRFSGNFNVSGSVMAMLSAEG
ncbi:FOG: CheY-like receiver [Hahella chejuensis KCTC 2396]|uniref:FOG: CheY-like receiver n=1 Tax=Hahella chejuensis (strain KCTC 2396) TaxID=349521 RepID=Q2SF29_HAHCH|nr:FOG: CheY-like receiver [Hahella chejuensis KCTC 2396]